jgi:hypothetical protein
VPLDIGKVGSHKKRKQTRQSAPPSHQRTIQQHTKKKVVATKPSSSTSSDSSDNSSTSDASTSSTASSESSSSSESSDSDTSTAESNVKANVNAAPSSAHRPGPDLDAPPVQKLATAFMTTLSVSARPQPNGKSLTSSPFPSLLQHTFYSTWTGQEVHSRPKPTPSSQQKECQRDRDCYSLTS